MIERHAEITVFTKSGGPLSKHIELIDGKIANDSSSCRMAKGFAHRVRIDLANMASLADLINGFSPKEAYAIGRLKHGLPDRVRVVRADKLNGDPLVIARTKNNLVFVEGEPGLALKDIDLKGIPEDAKGRIKDAGGGRCATGPTGTVAGRVKAVDRPPTGANTARSAPARKPRAANARSARDPTNIPEARSVIAVPARPGLAI
jgi:hypothetical protein